MQHVIVLEISLKQSELFRCLGYKNNMKPSPEISYMLHNLLDSISNQFKVFATYKIINKFQLIDNQKIITQFGEIKSQVISSLAKQAKNLLIGLVTVHEIFNNRDQNDLLFDYLEYGVGIGVVEKGIDSLLSKIEKEVGLYASLPFSPGYCDWDMEGQQFIFNALDPSVIKVKLLPKSLRMIPIHTISFISILGIKKSDRNPCKYCTVKNCMVKRS